MSKKDSVKAKQPEKNGITQPKTGTTSAKIWAIAAKLSGTATVEILKLLAACEKEGYNSATIKTQYARWKKFNGIKGRIANKAKVAPKKKAPAKKKVAAKKKAKKK